MEPERSLAQAEAAGLQACSEGQGLLLRGPQAEELCAGAKSAACLAELSLQPTLAMLENMEFSTGTGAEAGEAEPEAGPEAGPEPELRL
jgi:hypothetical protein